MFEQDDEVLEELQKSRELSKKSFKKVLNKDKLSSFEMDEALNGF